MIGSTFIDFRWPGIYWRCHLTWFEWICLCLYNSSLRVLIVFIIWWRHIHWYNIGSWVFLDLAFENVLFILYFVCVSECHHRFETLYAGVGAQRRMPSPLPILIHIEVVWRHGGRGRGGAVLILLTSGSGFTPGGECGITQMQCKGHSYLTCFIFDLFR